MNDLKSSPKPKVSTKAVIEALLDQNTPFPLVYLEWFSDLTPSAIRDLEKAWPQVAPARRIEIAKQLEEMNETDTMVLFNEFAKIAMKDAEPAVRVSASMLLREDPELDLVPALIRLVNEDPEASVRAAYAATLGMYVYEGEMEEIPENVKNLVEEALLKKYNSADETIVRRRALEAVSFSSRKEINDLLIKAYKSGEAGWMVTALFGMGRNLDQRWARYILPHIKDADPEIQLEAVRAAGELGMKEAREPLIELLEDSGDLDDETRFAAIWSLSEIGGENVQETLVQIMEDSEDDELTEFVEDALDNLTFTDGMNKMDMFDFDIDEEGDAHGGKKGSSKLVDTDEKDDKSSKSKGQRH